MIKRGCSPRRQNIYRMNIATWCLKDGIVHCWATLRYARFRDNECARKPESRNGEVGMDFRCRATACWNRFCCKHAFPWQREIGRSWTMVRLTSIPVATDTQITTDGHFQGVFFFRYAPSYKSELIRQFSQNPICGGGFEYLHSRPASRRRRRIGKSRIWESKIWSRVSRDSDPKITALSRSRSNCKWRTRPLVRETAPRQQARNCLTVIKIWS
jgi:hypothetical protein